MAKSIFLISLLCWFSVSLATGCEAKGSEARAKAQTSAEPEAGVGLSIGLLANIDGGNAFIVQGVVPGSAAAKADICMHDVIVSVNNADVHELSMDDIVSKIRGKSGSHVKITLLHQGQRRTVKLVRKKLPTSDKASEVKYLPE